MGLQDGWCTFEIHSYADKPEKTEVDMFQIVKKSFFNSWALISYYDEVMEVHSSAIIRFLVRSHNQGRLINRLSLKSNYQTVLLDWDGYSAKLPTKDIV